MAKQRRLLIAGNWKMHKTLAEARELVASIREGAGAIEGVQQVDLLICPPFQHLFPMAKALAGSDIGMGAQNCHESDSGAFTGEVSAPMIKDTGAQYVIVGHSERRHVFGEAGERLAAKVRAGLNAELNVIYCIGETLNQREAGQTQDVLGRQIDEVLDGSLDPTRLVVAYEPVWAIGTGRNATPDQAQEAHSFVRGRLAEVFSAAAASNLRILYGGSVKPSNAGEILGQPDVDGALVGGASLVAGDFLGIIRAAIG